MRMVPVRKAALAATALVGIIASSSSIADEAGTPGIARRLTTEQYVRVIGDTFGPTVKIGGRFEPDVRVDGLIEVGAGRVSISSTGLDQYDSMARSIAAQVLSEENRAIMLPCAP